MGLPPVCAHFKGRYPVLIDPLSLAFAVKTSDGALFVNQPQGLPLGPTIQTLSAAQKLLNNKNIRCVCVCVCVCVGMLCMCVCVCNS